jgi:hypothetical protein
MQQDNSIVEQAISSELSADEKVLWCGQPPGGLQFNLLNVAAFPFGIAFLAFGVIWGYLAWGIVFTQPTSAAYRSPIDLFTPILMGIGFFAVGLFLVFGLFFVDRYWRKNTYYVVTNQRVIIMTKWLATNVQSLALQQLPQMTLTTKANGSGNIVFGSTGPVGAIGTTVSPTPPSFDKIDDARKVQDIILDAQQQVGKQQ